MRTGTFTATGTASIGGASPSRTGFMLVQFTGTFSATIEFEGSLDGTNYVDLSALPVSDLYDTTAAATSVTAVGLWRVDTSGLPFVRLNCSTFASGPVEWAAVASVG